MGFELKQHFQIESARFLPRLDKNHPCARMHGHSFKVILGLRGSLNPKLGWLRDYHEISQIAGQILAPLDHRVLNEVPGLENPTSENISVWLYEQLKPMLPELFEVTVQETSSTECTFRPSQTDFSAQSDSEK